MGGGDWDGATPVSLRSVERRDPIEMMREAQEEKEKRASFLRHRVAGLKGKLTKAARKLMAPCRDCGCSNIRVKVSHHLADPGEFVVGPGGRSPSFARHLDFLFCEDCGKTMFNSKVAVLAEILEEIAKTERKLSEVNSPLC